MLLRTAYTRLRRRIFMSVCLRWVMSRAIFEAPTTRPWASWIGEMVSETSIGLPSLRLRTVSKCVIRSPRFSRSTISVSSASRPSGMSSDYRSADHFLRAVTQQLLGAAVPARDHPVEGLADDGIVGRFHDRRHPRGGLLRPFSLGDVADYPEQIAVGHRGRDHFHRKNRAVLAPELPLPVMNGPSPDLLQHGLDFPDLRFRDDVRSMQPDQFAAGIAEHPAHALVGVEVAALRIGDQDAVGRMLEERTVAPVAFVPGSFSLLTRSPPFRRASGARRQFPRCPGGGSRQRATRSAMPRILRAGGRPALPPITPTRVAPRTTIANAMAALIIGAR